MDWDKISIALNKKLDPAAVKPPPKGKFGEYVDAYHVISEANRIFGNGGWSYTITRLQETHRAEIDLGGKTQFRCSFLCTVKVQVGETTREGSAVGMGSGKPENMGDVIESAVKEAETDALKRALRTYGNTFGLALYDKSQANVGVDATDAEIETAVAVLSQAASVAMLEDLWRGYKKDVPHLLSQPAVIDAARKRKTEITQHKEAA
jgi:DNA repair and recombination protein RAD52